MRECCRTTFTHLPHCKALCNHRENLKGLKNIKAFKNRKKVFKYKAFNFSYGVTVQWNGNSL